ncbi:TK/FGFR protein kinase [Aphelenchoides besseyi]|nr:TK/FGFR protein kinase [Aphelenchoides besseyi]KAI6201943.1 TK/FGFR protein kinase [Aphelenchoides besseyi]
MKIKLLIVLLVLENVFGQYVTKSSPPRFKQSVRRHQYTYLGDTAKFKCDSIGRPLPKVHWYRNGVYLNYSFMQERPRIQEKGMELEIRRVEVGDKGQWTCRVWNSEGSIMRNFTLHIIDYCDFYLTSEAEATNTTTSEACLCEWISTDDPAFDDEEEILDFRDKYCPKYEKENQVTKFRTTAQLSPCKTPNCEDEDMEQFLKTFHRRSEKETRNDETNARDFAVPSYSASHYPTNTPLDTEEKLQRARTILKQRIPILNQQHDQGIQTEENDLFSHENPVDSLRQDKFMARADTFSSNIGEMIDITPAPQALISSMGESGNDLTATGTTTRRWSPIWNTRSWKVSPAPARVAPYFRQTDEQTTIVVPSGRTLRLNCKAGGIPEPQVIWRKDHVEISAETERKSGSIYRIRKWTLELEDAAEGDSGHYTCDVFNNVGNIHRDFRVDVRDRIRARPIILPNVLVNKTVDVNGTVNFTCQVLSDLVPHVVWIHLIQINGSYIRWDERQNRNVFNFIDMSTIKKAQIFHDNQNKLYSLIIKNVSVEDQGIYSCIAGSTLGVSMANATLTVNEFRGMTLPTDSPYPPWSLIYTIFLVLLVMSLVSFLTLGAMYYLFSRRVNKSELQNLEKMTVRKKVVITKKPKEGDVWSDLASSYTITVEPVVGKGQSRNRTRVNSEMSLVSEYEVPTDVAWEIERSRLTLIDIIGEGAFGEVWRGELRSRSFVDNKNNNDETKPLNDDNKLSVAVKKLKSTAQEKELIILVSEMQIFKSIGRHKNILKLVGCCTGTGPLLVVLELCPHGNLRDFLRRHRPHGVEAEEDSQQNHTPSTRKSTVDNRSIVLHNLTLRDLIRFATEISCGMEFLSSKKIIHRDLAARNILVAHDFTAKISDFGLSRNVFCQDYYRKRGAGRLPIKWMAPEALEANVYTVYSDVWSYGIVLWEIMTLGGTPYPTIAMPQLYNLLKEGYRMEAPHNCPEEIYGVMVMCWQEKAENRPQFQTICDYLEWIVQEAIRMSTAGIYDHYMETEMGVQTTLNGDSKPQISRPLSAPGLMSIQSFARGLPNLAIDEVDRRLHESTPLLTVHTGNQSNQQLKPQVLPKNSAKNSSEWDAPLDVTGSDLKHKKSVDRLANSNHLQSQTIYTTPLLNCAPSASNAESSLSNTETEYHEAIPYANIHYMNDHKHSINETSTRPVINQSSTHKSFANYPSEMDPKNVYEIIGNGRHLKAEPEEKKPQRTQSLDSQSSSGHGGSSAMSSAENFGGIGEFCQIQLTLKDKVPHSSDPKTP